MDETNGTTTPTSNADLLARLEATEADYKDLSSSWTDLDYKFRQMRRRYRRTYSALKELVVHLEDKESLITLLADTLKSVQA